MKTLLKERYAQPVAEVFRYNEEGVICASGGFDDLNPYNPWFK